MRRRKIEVAVNHRIFSIYSLTISFIYMFRVIFELATQNDENIDVQSQVVECLFVVFGVLISIALHNAYDTRLSLISISWTIWMFINTIFALFVVNSDIIQLVINRLQNSIPLSNADSIKLIIDILHFFNIPISLYFICIFLISAKKMRKRHHRHSKKKSIMKRDFEVTNAFIGDEMVYYV